MKNPDEAVAKVYAALRDAEATPGMERRILQAVQARAAARSQSGWRGWRPPWLSPSTRRDKLGLLAACGTLACMVAAVWLSSAFHRSVLVPTRPSGTALVSPSLPTPLARATVPVRRSRRSPQVRPTARRGNVVRDQKDAARRAMLATSYPAPPLPMTEQEKLLLRIAHQGEPVQLAMLNPEMRAKEQAQGNAEFQRFFKSTATGESK